VEGRGSLYCFEVLLHFNTVLQLEGGVYMSIDKDLWMEHLVHIDRYANIKSFTQKKLTEWFTPLIDSITGDGAVPYLLGTAKRFRASPLSSTISWLEQEGLIPVEILDKMQTMLLKLRDANIDNDEEIGKNEKKPEDIDGWSLGEGVSVWSTSMAIIAMLDTYGNGQKKATEFKSSVLWLVKQRNENEKGWAYQLYTNCAVNTIMTALAVRALALAITQPNKDCFNFTNDEFRDIKIAILGGFDYLKEMRKQEHGKIYWTFNEIPHCVATTWALLALRQMSQVGEFPDAEDCYSSSLEGSLSFVLSKMPTEIQEWESEQIVCEGGAKYSKQKNYYSFSATLLPQLFVLGLSPYEPKVINQIAWLIKNPDEWKIEKYDRTSICTFTYAMVLAVLIAWEKRVGSLTASIVLNDQGKVNKISKILFGFNSSNKVNFQLISKNRLVVCGFVLTFLLLLKLLDHNGIILRISNRIANIWVSTASDRHAIVVNVISSVLHAALVAIFWGIYRFINSKWRNRK